MDVTNQVNVVATYNDNHYQKLIEINERLNASKTYSKDFDAVVRFFASGYNKKIVDSMIALQDLYKNSSGTYDSAYETSEKYFNKNSSFVSATLPQIVTYGSALSFEVKFMNIGMYYSWTDDKNIVLVCRIIRNDGQVGQEEIVDLDTSGDNTPGDENTNGDFRKVKTFDFSFTLDPVEIGAGEYTFMFYVSDSEDDTYQSTYRQNVSVVSA